MTHLYKNRKAIAFFISIFFTTLVGCELQETDFIQPTPIALEATDITSASFTASWEPVLGSNIYFLDVSPDQDFSSFVSGYQSLEVEGTSVSVNGLSVEETYYYRVRAKKGNTISDNSNVIIVETGLLPAPVALAPSDLKVFQFTANWSTVGEAASYLIEVASDSGFTNILNTYDGKEIVSNSEIIQGLDYRETYYYRVMTKRLNKTSAYSNIMEVKPCISESCKLSRIVLPATYTQEVTFGYDANGRLTEIQMFYTDYPTTYNKKWTVEYTPDENVDSVKYYFEDVLTEKHKFIYTNGLLTSTPIYDPANQIIGVKDFIYNDLNQLVGYRRYDDLTRSNTTYYEDYEVDVAGNVLTILTQAGDQKAEFKYDDAFNPKMLIPFELRQFIGDSFSGFTFRPYHNINNPIYARGEFQTGYLEEEVFIYDKNTKDIATQRKGFYSLQYEFTGCTF